MLGVCYYPEHWPEDFWPEDARRMRELAIAYVRIGEFAWVRYEPRRGEFQRGWLDRAMKALGDAGQELCWARRRRLRPSGWINGRGRELAALDLIDDLAEVLNGRLHVVGVEIYRDNRLPLPHCFGDLLFGIAATESIFHGVGNKSADNRRLVVAHGACTRYGHRC